MHQTFYIDIDEEITSVIERLRKARAEEIVLVVPKRALLIQSIVNLRLLKREADNLGLSIMIVTQDKLGKLLVEKAGILVQQKMGDLGEEEIISSDEGVVKKNDADISQENNYIHKKDDLGRISQIGSENYFDSSASKNAKNVQQRADTSPVNSKGAIALGNEIEKITNKELVTGLTEDIRRRKTPTGIDSMRTESGTLPRTDVSKQSLLLPDKPEAFRTGSFLEGKTGKVGVSPTESQDKKIENFFQANAFTKPNNSEKNFSESKAERIHVSGRFKKMFFVFGFVFVLAIIFGLSYLLLPKATIFITTKVKEKTAEAEITGSISALEIDFENKIIPAKEVSVSDEVAETYSTSGSKKVSIQKAHGKITIYNEFSSSPQPLVATTRFLSEDGKLFRLVSAVTVPGTKKNGDLVTPGEIEAEVAADESGEGFNVGPSKFSIPGFKDSGGNKYEKIYAKSSENMTGGGSSGNSASSLSQADIDQAKEKILSKIKEVAKKKLEEKTGDGAVFLEDAITIDEPTYKVSNSPGEVVDSFQLKVQMNVKSIVFQKSDIDKVFIRSLAKNDVTVTEANNMTVELDYGKSNIDYKSGTIDVKVHGVGRLSSGIDSDNLRKGALGKTNEELKNYLSNYPDIEKVEISYWPVFLSSRIPLYEKRVFVEVAPAD